MGQKYPTSEKTKVRSPKPAKSTKPQKEMEPALKIIKPRTIGQSKYEEAIINNTLVFCEGPAGTGKTLLAAYRAIKAYYDGEVSKIILSKPIVEAGEQLGFLPGTLLEKVDPIMKPLYDCLEQCIKRTELLELLRIGTIEVCPLAFMRGRTLSNSFIILDEAQNATYSQLKLALTRIGEDSKMVVTSDKHQIDLPYKNDSGIVDISEKLENTESVAHVILENKDVQRSAIVKYILEKL